MPYYFSAEASRDLTFFHRSSWNPAQWHVHMVKLICFYEMIDDLANHQLGHLVSDQMHEFIPPRPEKPPGEPSPGSDPQGGDVTLSNYIAGWFLVQNMLDSGFTDH